MGPFGARCETAPHIRGIPSQAAPLTVKYSLRVGPETMCLSLTLFRPWTQLVPSCTITLSSFLLFLQFKRATMLLKSGAGLRRVILTVVLLFGTVSHPGFSSPSLG